MSDETNTPQAPDEWWKAAAANVDKAAAEKAAIAAEDFQAHRRWHYYNTGQERARHQAHDAEYFSATVFNRRRFQ